MNEKLIALLGLDAGASEDEIVAEVQQLKRITNSPGAKQEKEIRLKIAAGLSRESAIQVLKDQAEDDRIRQERDEQAAEAAAEAAKAAKAKTEKDKEPAK
jgi:hypothetical protein